MGGDKSQQYFMRNERMVIYTPKKGYTGPDMFTYRMIDGLEIQEYIGSNGQSTTKSEVTAHVRRCRKYISDKSNSRNQTIHPICDCMSSESGIIRNITACDISRTAICDLESSKQDFLNLCLTCNDLGFQSGECQAETLRAVGMLEELGFCANDPVMDCSGETFTRPGREAVNYMSMKTYPVFGSFTPLGKLFRQVHMTLMYLYSICLKTGSL